MIYSRRFVLNLFLSSLIPFRFGDEKQKGSEPKAEPSPVKITDIPALKIKLSVSSIAEPLADILKEITKQTGIPLSVSSPLSDQRMTIHITDGRLCDILSGIVNTLSHSPEKPFGVAWYEFVAENKNGYRLARDIEGRRAERQALNLPKKEAKENLLEWQRVAKMNEEERNAYNGPLFTEWVKGDWAIRYQKAIKSLSKQQIDQLINGVACPMDASLFAEQVAFFQENYRNRMERFRKTVLGAGQSDPFPNGIPKLPPPQLQITPDDENGRAPWSAMSLSLRLVGLDTRKIESGSEEERVVLNPPRFWNGPLYKPAEGQSDPEVDLTAVLSARKSRRNKKVIRDLPLRHWQKPPNSRCFRNTSINSHAVQWVLVGWQTVFGTSEANSPR